MLIKDEYEEPLGKQKGKGRKRKIKIKNAEKF